MFNNAHRWMARQGKAVPVVFSAFSAIVWFGAGATFEWHIAVSVVITFITTLIYITAPVSCANKFMAKAVKAWENECDPYPLLRETEEQLTYKKLSNKYRLVVLINHCVALHSLGQTEDAMSFMEQVNPEEIKGTNDNIKLVYYTNLANYCYRCDRIANGDLYYAKAVEIRDRIKNQNLYELYSKQINSLGAIKAYKQGECERALGMTDTFVAKNKRESASNAMMKAKILLALGRIDEAKKELQFVCENGNKLYIAKEAADILAKI